MFRVQASAAAVVVGGGISIAASLYLGLPLYALFQRRP